MANVYRVQWVGTDASGATNVTGFHIQTDVPTLGEEPDPNDILDGFDGAYTTIFRTCVPGSFSFVSLQLRQMVLPDSSEIPVAAEKALSGGGEGDDGDGTLSTSLTIILGLTTNAALRSARGYMAIPSPVNPALMDSENIIGGALHDAIDNLGSAIEDSFDVGSTFPTHCNPVVYSRRRHLELLDPFTFRITGHKVNRRIMWRRSRVSIP